MGDRPTEAGLEAWEHAYVQASTLGLNGLTRALNDLGADGWELVSTHSADKTLGLNSVTAFVRRRIVPLPAPTSHDDGWYPDPSGRYQHRRWNGRAWTFHVATNGEAHRDPPTFLDPTPGLTQ